MTTLYWVLGGLTSLIVIGFLLYAMAMSRLQKR